MAEAVLENADAGLPDNQPGDESLETNPQNPISKELASIRQRRTQVNGRRFPSATEDFVLLAGIGYAIFFFLGLFAMSSGIFGQSTALDHKASDTILDIGGQCMDTSDQSWILIFPDNDKASIQVTGYNFGQDSSPNAIKVLNWSAVGDAELSDEKEGLRQSIPIDDWDEGEYKFVVKISLFNSSEERENGTVGEYLAKEVDLEIEREKNTLSFLPFVDDEVKTEATIDDDSARSCWGVTDLGNWGWGLMGAELGGGRETAMLTGGAAGVPAWWMAFISLSLSVISLFLAYPVMYKVYHQDTDDMLGRNHIEVLLKEILTLSEKRLHINIDWDLFKSEIRDLSIDIMIPYHNTEDTLSNQNEIRSEVLREILDEFALFRVFKPVQLTVRSIGENQAIDFETGVGIGSGMLQSEDEEELVVNDYTSFFKDLHLLSQIEDEVRESIRSFFSENDELLLQMATVTSEDSNIFVRVAYKPTQKLAFFRFKQTNEEVVKELKTRIMDDNPDLTDTHKLEVKGNNMSSTLADRSGAGRVETHASAKNEDSRVAAVAKQDGFGGMVLQTKLFGDILSTVEYTANEKRDMINKYGFWGLIVFVWIPFMASGVLVGAMLGLLSRMKFMRVLWATFLGGAAASLTWAYTAEGIITVMHKYKLEAVIPIAIIAFVLMAVLHMRSTKNRRLAELFEDTLLDSFHDEVQDKYGQRQEQP